MTLYRRELLNMKNPEEYRFALKLMHKSSVIKDPAIAMLYFKEFGVHSEEDKRELDWAKIQINVINSCVGSLEERLKTIPEDIDEVIYRIPGDCFLPHIKAIKKGSENKPKDKRKRIYI
ncbi:hypothetical protein BMS3Abin17_00277 [archaeon BMS3Abin17]|nr:hypothetical protein BMS3Abin17_00277 [archaeon BMS3Abin17]HDZ60358.1 hypothetical protein [Candidatus Pacearchaeota archaeon]